MPSTRFITVGPLAWSGGARARRRATGADPYPLRNSSPRFLELGRAARGTLEPRGAFVLVQLNAIQKLHLAVFRRTFVQQAVAYEVERHVVRDAQIELR